jgi:hypothetical protein
MESNARTFRYKYNTEFRACYLIFLILFGIFLGSAVAYRGERLFGVEFATVWCLLFVPLSINAVLGSSSVVVSSEYIGWSLFGRIWKIRKWNEVKGIRIIPLRQFPTAHNIDTYYIDASAPPKIYFLRGGSIWFHETINDFDILKEYIDTSANKYAIPIKNMSLR